MPTDRELCKRQEALLNDPEITLVWAEVGDLTAFHSGALHFASNGADCLSASLYHGMIARAGLPRLRQAAAEMSGPGATGDYSGHLLAADLLRLVETRLSERTADT